jgi:hypothetical protein
MSNIEEKHRKEWAASAIRDSLIDHNLTSIDGPDAFDYLLYGIEDKDRRNDGRLRDNVLNSYKHLNSGGWWCGGVNPLTGDRLDWGCLKPDSPRPDKNDPNKLIKYEHPPKTPTRIFALRIPYEVGQGIAKRFGLTEEYQARAAGKEPAEADRHFWEWAIDKKQIPLLITEGAKKGAALLSHGYLAVALPGIWGAYRQDKDNEGQKQGDPYLIDDIKPLIKGRDVVFVFDQETKPQTKYFVAMAQSKTSELIAEAGGQDVSAIRWDLKRYPQKGVDDLIAANGPEAFDHLFQKDRDRVKDLPDREQSIDYLVGDKICVHRRPNQLDRAKLDTFIFEANLINLPPRIAPENTIYIELPKTQKLQNLPPPTMAIKTLDSRCYCWKVHGATAAQVQALQADLIQTTGAKPVSAIPAPGAIDMFSGYKTQATDITAKSYSLEYLRQAVPDQSPAVTPRPILRQPEPTIQPQIEELSR